MQTHELPTPRTDGAQYQSDPDAYGQREWLVPARHARELEQELTEAKRFEALADAVQAFMVRPSPERETAVWQAIGAARGWDGLELHWAMEGEETCPVCHSPFAKLYQPAQT